MAQATDVLAACTASQAPFIVAGDFNLEPTEAVLGRPLLLVPSVPLTMRPKVHLCQPQVRGESAELIMGYVTGRLLASQVDCFNVPFSDHTSVAYDVPLDAPAFLSMPKRVRPPTLPRKTFNYSLRLPTLVLFGVQSRRLTLTQLGQVLSDIAEQCLCTPAADPTQGVTSGHQLWRVPAQAAGSRALLL